MGVQLLDELIAVHPVDGTRLFQRLTPGSGAAQAVHTDLHKVGGSGLVNVQNVPDDGLTGHLLGGFLLILLEHIENIKHDKIPFCTVL